MLVSAAGDISLADKELQISRTHTPQNHQSSTLLKHFLFSSAASTFLPSHSASSYSAVSVSLLRSGDVIRISVVGVDGETITSLGECVLPVEEAVRTPPFNVNHSHINPFTRIYWTCPAAAQGSSAYFVCYFIALLEAFADLGTVPSGSWLAFSLSTSPSGALSVTQAAEPLRLQGLTFIGGSRTSEATLAALTSSHVLLAAVTAGSPLEIVILLWDLRYGVLLAQQSISVPSTLPRPKKYGAVLRLEVAPPTVSSSK